MSTVQTTIFKYAEVEKNVIMWKKIIPNDDHYNEIVKQDLGEMFNSKFIENN
jgi:hypothetical protein